VRRETRASLEAAALPGQGASLGEEAVSADSGRVGEVAARVGRVRSRAFLSILQGMLLLSKTCAHNEMSARPQSFSAVCYPSAIDWLTDPDASGK